MELKNVKQDLFSGLCLVLVSLVYEGKNEQRKEEKEKRKKKDMERKEGGRIEKKDEMLLSHISIMREIHLLLCTHSQDHITDRYTYSIHPSSDYMTQYFMISEAQNKSVYIVFLFQKRR